MRNLQVVLVLLIVLGQLTSCKKSTGQADTYFDSLVVAQVNYLSSVSPSLTKVANLDGKKDQSTFTPDSTSWKNELDVFRQLALFERPAYRDAYHLQDGMNDEKSNLLIRHYTANREIPIPDIKFYYYKELKNLKKIEATYQQGNALYTTTRKLILEFEEVKGNPILIGYGIDGSQKMILSDSVKFSIQSRINYSF
jgi:hypothetical protein